jgi:hypothetical protein
MAKLFRGRIVLLRRRFGGFAGMDAHAFEELHAWANRLERRSHCSDPADDPRWLQRRADRLRDLAVQKERAREHKAAQRAVGRTRRST